VAFAIIARARVYSHVYLSKVYVFG
jgi:hypothetical protein